MGLLRWIIHNTDHIQGSVFLLRSDAVASRLANGSAAFIWKLRCHKKLVTMLVRSSDAGLWSLQIASLHAQCIYFVEIYTPRIVVVCCWPILPISSRVTSPTLYHSCHCQWGNSGSNPYTVINHKNLLKIKTVTSTKQNTTKPYAYFLRL